MLEKEKAVQSRLENERFYFDSKNYTWRFQENNQEVPIVIEGDVIGDKVVLEKVGAITVNETGRPLCIIHNKLMVFISGPYGMDHAWGWVCPEVNKELEMGCKNFIIVKIT